MKQLVNEEWRGLDSLSEKCLNIMAHFAYQAALVGEAADALSTAIADLQRALTLMKEYSTALSAELKETQSPS